MAENIEDPLGDGLLALLATVLGAIIGSLVSPWTPQVVFAWAIIIVVAMVVGRVFWPVVRRTWAGGSGLRVVSSLAYAAAAFVFVVFLGSYHDLATRLPELQAQADTLSYKRTTVANLVRLHRRSKTLREMYPGDTLLVAPGNRPGVVQWHDSTLTVIRTRLGDAALEHFETKIQEGKWHGWSTPAQIGVIDDELANMIAALSGYDPRF